MQQIRLGRWRSSRASLQEHVEAGSLRIGNKIYIVGGYQTLTRMCTRMQIFDIETETWSYGPELPAGFALSHAGLASDGRFLFFVSGQPGPACEPATDKVWALDLETMAWQPMAPLPEARYSPVCQYVDGNLHAISGAIEDRETISRDHFVLRIRDSNSAGPLTLPALHDQRWEKRAPIPAGGDHAASILFDGKIYVIGGEHGHAAMTMNAAECCGAYFVHKSLFRYDPKSDTWERLADMPFGSSHIESQVIAIDHRFLVLGGTGDRDVFVDKVQEYDVTANRWRELKPLPVARKGSVLWMRGDVLYLNGGQVMNKNGERPVIAQTIAARIKRGSWLDLFRR